MTLKHSVKLPETKEQNLSVTITIPNLDEIKNITIDTGKVKYEILDKKTGRVKLTVSDGDYSKRVQTGGYIVPGKSKYVTGQRDKNYSDSDGYSGELKPYYVNTEVYPGNKKYPLNGETLTLKDRDMTVISIIDTKNGKPLDRKWISTYKPVAYDNRIIGYFLPPAHTTGGITGDEIARLAKALGFVNASEYNNFDNNKKSSDYKVVKEVIGAKDAGNSQREEFFNKYYVNRKLTDLNTKYIDEVSSSTMNLIKSMRSGPGSWLNYVVDGPDGPVSIGDRYDGTSFMLNVTADVSLTDGYFYRKDPINISSTRYEGEVFKQAEDLRTFDYYYKYNIVIEYSSIYDHVSLSFKNPNIKELENDEVDVIVKVGSGAPSGFDVSKGTSFRITYLVKSGSSVVSRGTETATNTVKEGESTLKLTKLRDYIESEEDFMLAVSIIDSKGYLMASVQSDDIIYVGFNMFINVGGNWKKSTDVYVNVNGDWKKAVGLFTNVGGNWKKA